MKNRKILKKSLLLIVVSLLVVTTSFAQTFMDLEKVPVDRTILPLREPTPPTITELDARNVKNLPSLFRVEAPKDAPNVVIIMLDDLGYAGTSTFGGVVPTPTMDKLADNGIKYTHFHSTAQCASTRIALNTGRNHHSCNTGIIGEMATSLPGYTG